ncbi:MAG: cell division protein ZapA [Vicinamibacterales bacterium]
MDEPRLVTVEINGQRYPIRSQLDAAYVAELAIYVEQKMQLAARESPAGDSLKIAVLAALNIADECFRAREEGADQQADLVSRTRDLERMLDLALESAGVGQETDGGSALARTAGSF